MVEVQEVNVKRNEQTGHSYGRVRIVGNPDKALDMAHVIFSAALGDKKWRICEISYAAPDDSAPASEGTLSVEARHVGQ